MPRHKQIHVHSLQEPGVDGFSQRRKRENAMAILRRVLEVLPAGGVRHHVLGELAP